MVFDAYEDPVVKQELNKYNYSSMIDLNRDFQFYINHPDKIKKINRVKKIRALKLARMREHPGSIP